MQNSYFLCEGISLERVCAHPFTCAWVALLTYSAHAVRCSLLPCLPSHSTWLLDSCMQVRGPEGFCHNHYFSRSSTLTWYFWSIKKRTTCYLCMCFIRAQNILPCLRTSHATPVPKILPSFLGCIVAGSHIYVWKWISSHAQNCTCQYILSIYWYFKALYSPKDTSHSKQNRDVASSMLN